MREWGKKGEFGQFNVYFKKGAELGKKVRDWIITAGYLHVEAMNAGTVMCAGAQHAGMAAAAGNLRSAKTETVDAGVVEEAVPEQVGVKKAGIYESSFGIF